MTADKMPDYIFAWRDETPNKRPRWSPIIPGPKAELWEKYIRADLPDPRLEILAAALRGFVLYDGQISHCGFRPEIEAAKKALRDTNLGG